MSEFKTVEDLWTNRKYGEPEHPLSPQEWETIRQGIPKEQEGEQ